MDTGQALVILMLAIALIGALIAFTIDAIREANAETNKSSRPIRWINISSTDAIDFTCSWLAQLPSALRQESVELANLAAPGATGIQVANLLTTSDAETQVDLATVWIGPEDFLAGTQILEFEECLDSILNWLEAMDATILVANLPDFTPELVAAKLADPVAIRPVFEQWNATIDRVAVSHSATVVDLSQPVELHRSSIRYLFATRFDPNPEAQSFVARQFADAISDTSGLNISNG